MDVSVKEAADRLGVSERRVQALIEAERLPARRVGHSWLVPVEELSRVKYRSRPLSPRMARALIQSLSSEASGLAGANEAQHRNRLLMLLEDDDPAGLIRSWLAAAAPPVRRFAAASRDLEDLSADPRVVPSGISDPRAGIAALGELEGWVAEQDLMAVQREFMLVESPRPNVLLHVAEEPPSRPLLLGWLIADLAAYGSPRESAAVKRLLEESRPYLSADKPHDAAALRRQQSAAQAAARQAAKARAIADRQAAMAARAKVDADRQAAQAARAQAAADRRAAVAARALAAAQRADAHAQAALDAANRAERVAARRLGTPARATREAAKDRGTLADQRGEEPLVRPVSHG